jgi:hypothetical protein
LIWDEAIIFLSLEATCRASGRVWESPLQQSLAMRTLAGIKT